jgi:hypothetical protein
LPGLIADKDALGVRLELSAAALAATALPAATLTLLRERDVRGAGDDCGEGERRKLGCSHGLLRVDFEVACGEARPTVGAQGGAVNRPRRRVSGKSHGYARAIIAPDLEPRPPETSHACPV